MKRVWSCVSILIAFAVPLVAEVALSTSDRTAARPTEVEFLKDGKVEFYAVGWPSALKIRGQGAAPNGKLTVAGNAVHGTIGFDLETLRTGIALRDRHMKEQYLETERFPRAALTLTRVDLGGLPPSGDFAKAKIPFDGRLSLHGSERPVRGEASLTRRGERVTGTAEFAIKVGDFGIPVPQYLGITVAEQVQIKVNLAMRLAVSHAAQR